MGSGVERGPNRAPDEFWTAGPVAWPILLAGALAAAIILALFVIITYAVGMRYFLGTPIPWAEEATGYLVVALLPLGSGAALLSGNHIAIDLLTANAPPVLQRGLSILASVSVLVVAVLITWSAWGMIAFNRDFGTYSTGPMEIEIWKVQTPLLVGFAFLSYAALINLVRAIRRPPPRDSAAEIAKGAPE